MSSFRSLLSSISTTLNDRNVQWYNSFVKYYSKRSGVTDGIATYGDLLKSTYVSNTFRAKFIVDAHQTTQADPFNKEQLIRQYQNHITYVENYFKDRPQDLLTVNITNKSAFQIFLAFIGKTGTATEFPWENKIK